MIIVITAEHHVSQESERINALFREGLDLLHIRKYNLQEKAMRTYIERIAPCYRQQLVLHSHHQLADEMGIIRLHDNAQQRQYGCSALPSPTKIRSTSTHSIAEFNTLEPLWTYAFLSPVFASISKAGYGQTEAQYDYIRHRNNPQVGLIALGGINVYNIVKTLQAGVDGVALLGAIWQRPDPVNAFVDCQRQAAQSTRPPLTSRPYDTSGSNYNIPC